MKKIIILITVTVLLLTSAALCVSASFIPNIVEIKLQPQSYNYFENSAATYIANGSGNYLRAFWYLEWQGKKYDITDTLNETEPWEEYAGEYYGASKLDDNTFMFTFSAIGKELDGAYIWCVVDDGHFEIESEKARITVTEKETSLVGTQTQSPDRDETGKAVETNSDAVPETDRNSDGGERDGLFADTTQVVLLVIIAVMCAVIGALAGILFTKKK